MKIIDTVPYFLNNYDPSVDFLKQYYAKYPDIFREYFSYHCKDTEERHLQSLNRYEDAWADIIKVHERIVPIIKETVEVYSNTYDIDFPVNVNLIVGGFGSNAYTSRQIIPDVTFALEKLSPELEHLQVIVAHEFDHAAQNILSDVAGMEWEEVPWESPLNWLYREGAATYFSKRVLPGIKQSAYFSYDDNGDEWLRFAEENFIEIKERFSIDMESNTPQEIFKEWFSINGGTIFGHTRLAYYLGYLYYKEIVDEKGERGAVLDWMEEGHVKQVREWLRN